MIQSFSRSRISKRPILLLGAGIYGEIANCVLTEIYHVSTSAVFDNKVKTVPWNSQPVMRSDEIANFKEADLIICAAHAFDELCREGEKYKNQGIEVYDMREMLREYSEFVVRCSEKLKSSCFYGNMDIQSIIMQYCFFAGEDNHYNDKIVLSYFVLYITSKCSLRCRYCGALNGKYDPKVDYSFESLKENMEILMSSIHGIAELELMGGEPFLHSEFDKILSWCIEQKKIHAIKIISNGTIVPEYATWELLKHNKVKLVIDDYGELSRSLGKLVDMSKKFKVRYEVLKLSTWYQYVEPIMKKSLPVDYLEEVFQSCIFRNCTGLLNGKVYRCLFSGHMHNLSLSAGIVDDYIQIEGVDWDCSALGDAIRKILNVKYLKSCDYCNYCNRIEISVAEQEREDKKS